MEEKILPLAKPILKTWASESHLMSMILQKQGAIDWFLNNHVNLMGKIEKDDLCNMVLLPIYDPMPLESVVNDWTSCPFLAVHYVSHSYIEITYNSIIEYVKKMIDEGYYLYMYTNPSLLKIGADKTRHRTFVYGYDDSAKKVYVADHYDKGRYTTVTVDFADFLAAYKSIHDGFDNPDFILTREYGEDIHSSVIVAKPREFSYTFNKKWLELQIEDYLGAKYQLDCVTYINHTKNLKKLYYGISCYTFLQQYLMSFYCPISKMKEIDCRLLTLLCDHKQLMVMRANYLQNSRMVLFTEFELKQYDELSKQASKVLLKGMMYNKRHKKNDIIHMKEILDSMESKEKELWEQMLIKLK